MAYWDAKAGTIVAFDDREVEDCPGWVETDCGCCGGLQWGGEQPVECDNCGGSGRRFKHLASGVIAMWPGGPFLGRQ
jgi:hypothetical protein